MAQLQPQLVPDIVHGLWIKNLFFRAGPDRMIILCVLFRWFSGLWLIKSCDIVQLILMSSIDFLVFEPTMQCIACAMFKPRLCNKCAMSLQCLSHVCAINMQCLWNGCAMNVNCLWNGCVMFYTMHVVQCLWN